MLGSSKDAPRGQCEPVTGHDEERDMSAQYWNDRNIQAYTEDGLGAAAWDDDLVLDAWLGSVTVAQFDGIMNFLMDQIYG
jgi:hypothetical protein